MDHSTKELVENAESKLAEFTTQMHALFREIKSQMVTIFILII